MTRLNSFRNSKKIRGSEKGIALFMVISALALLSILIAELTYSTQVNSRLAYNNIDNMKAYYIAKAGMKLSLLRLAAYKQIKKFIDDPNNPAGKAVGKDIIEKIWNFPFMYPIPIPKEATITQGDEIKKFTKESSMKGSYIANITSESNKMNLNNLFIKEVEDTSKNQNTGTGGANTTPKQPTSAAQTKQMIPVDIQPIFESAITTAIENKKREDKDFYDTYRNVEGKDVLDAIMAYLFKDKPNSNLPGFKQINPKEAPFYSLTELHLIPGIDDEIYNILESIFTVYSTPGININTADKQLFIALFPQATPDDIDAIMKRRDDPETGKPWDNADDFWKTVSDTSLGKYVDTLKEQLKKANIGFITSELNFKISVQATHGLSTKRLEAYVIMDAPEDKNKKTTGQNATTQTTQNNKQTTENQTQNDKNASAKKATGLNLIYWKIL